MNWDRWSLTLTLPSSRPSVLRPTVVLVQEILGIMGSQSLLHLGALSVRSSEGSLVLMAVCSVSYRFNTLVAYNINHS